MNWHTVNRPTSAQTGIDLAMVPESELLDSGRELARLHITYSSSTPRRECASGSFHPEAEGCHSDILGLGGDQPHGAPLHPLRALAEVDEMLERDNSLCYQTI